MNPTMRYRFLMVTLCCAMFFAWDLVRENARAEGKRFLSINQAKPAEVVNDSLILKGHTMQVFDLAFSPDGSKIATCSADDSVRLWDVSTGKQTHVFEGKDAAAVLFLPGGKRLASATGGTKCVVKIWDIETAKVVLTLQGHTGVINKVVASGDGKTLATASADESVRIWDANTGALVSAFKPHAGEDVDYSVRRLAFYPNNQHLAILTAYSACVWDIANAKKLVELSLQKNQDFQIAMSMSADGKKLATGGSDGIVRVWDARTGKELGVFREKNLGSVYDVAFHPTNPNLLANSFWPNPMRKHPYFVKLRNLETGKDSIVQQEFGRTFKFGHLAFGPDGKILAAAEGPQVRMWNIEKTLKEVQESKSGNEPEKK